MTRRTWTDLEDDEVALDWELDESLDPIHLQIRQEVEEFLRDLTLQYPFPEIFEVLKRHEYRDRFGEQVVPIPQKKISTNALKEIDDIIVHFLDDLKQFFGPPYADYIKTCFRYYTEATLEA